MADTFRTPVVRNHIGGPVEPLSVTHAIAAGLGISTLLKNRLIGTGRQTGVTGDAIVVDHERHDAASLVFTWVRYQV
jgi:hypothetical protein